MCPGKVKIPGPTFTEKHISILLLLPFWSPWAPKEAPKKTPRESQGSARLAQERPKRGQERPDKRQQTTGLQSQGLEHSFTAWRP